MRFSRPLRVILPALTGALALTYLAAVSAVPAESESYRDCYPDGENTICYTAHSVEKLADPNDQYSATAREVGSFQIEYFDAEGNLLWSSKTRWNTFTIDKDGEAQVYHDQTNATYSPDGETSCTAVHNANHANGETRHLGPEWQWVCK